MNLHEYIQALEELEGKEGGDILVVDSYDKQVSTPELAYDAYSTVVIVCEQA